MPRTLRKNNNKKVPAKVRRSKRRLEKTLRNRKQNGGCLVPLNRWGLRRNKKDQDTMNAYLNEKLGCTKVGSDFYKVYYEVLDDTKYDAKIKKLMENWPSNPRLSKPTTQVTLPPSTRPAPLPPPPTRQHIPPPTPPRANYTQVSAGIVKTKHILVYKVPYQVSSKNISC
jgi:hypothetical protein